jgi:endonuclease-3
MPAPAPARSLKPSPRKKLPFDVDEVFRRLREAVKPFRPAALFELAEEGHSSVFELLVACIVSIRTRDETTIPVSRRVFAAARTPEAMLRRTEDELAALLRPCTFPEPKARQILAIARRAVDEHGGSLPCDAEVLLDLPGVGPKCAGLVLGIACGQAFIGVDVHVHRVTNRWGYVTARTPEKTMTALEEVLPRAYWVEINRLLVPFGKHVCTGVRPRCSTCPVLAYCRQVGVIDHR